MDKLPVIRIGTCSSGPIVFPDGTNGHKYVICISNFDWNSHQCMIACKTTSLNHDKVFEGEFLMKDFFGRGKTKVQPYNILRITPSEIVKHEHLGVLEDKYMLHFKKGLQMAIKKKWLSAKEVLDLAESWSPFFAV